ncbi:MAG: DoxX family protein [Saprospiraceae bacterium]|jgi:putative oxidoreductase|nr:DoxX family protein [Saprospiraceae bacterium]
MKHLFDLVGRIFLSFIFLFEAYDSIKFFNDTKVTMTSYGLTWRQDMLLYGAIFVLILGGSLILTGYRSSFGATLLLLYWVPATFIIHSFWNDPIELQRQQSIEFMKNIAITGGLIMVMVNGSGRYSIRRLFATARVPGAD